MRDYDKTMRDLQHELESVKALLPGIDISRLESSARTLIEMAGSCEFFGLLPESCHYGVEEMKLYDLYDEGKLSDDQYDAVAGLNGALNGIMQVLFRDNCGCHFVNPVVIWPGKHERMSEAKKRLTVVKGGRHEPQL